MRTGWFFGCLLCIKLDPSSVALNKTTLTLDPGKTETLTATVLPSDASDKTVTWTSSNTSAATVSDGTVTAIAPGTATITATTVNGKTATCDVTVTAQASAPEVPAVSLSNNENGLTASWNKVDNAKSYVVFYKASSDSDWTKATTTDTSYTITEAQSGKLYYVKARSVGANNVQSSSSPTKSLTFLERTTVSSLAFSNDAVNAKWGKVSGATKYRIYYKESTALTWSAKTTSSLTQTIKNVAKGKVYNVRFCAVCDAGGGPLTPVQSIAVIDAPEVTAKISSNKTGIYTTWKGVTGADKYVVYYRKSGDSGWTTHETANLTYTLKNLTSGSIYQIKVAAMKEGGIGPFSDTQSVVFT